MYSLVIQQVLYITLSPQVYLPSVRLRHYHNDIVYNDIDCVPYV